MNTGQVYGSYFILSGDSPTTQTSDLEHDLHVFGIPVLAHAIGLYNGQTEDSVVVGFTTDFGLHVTLVNLLRAYNQESVAVVENGNLFWVDVLTGDKQLQGSIRVSDAQPAYNGTGFILRNGHTVWVTTE